MKKLLIAGLLLTAFLAGCKKKAEGEYVYVIDGKGYTLNEILKEMEIPPVQFNALKPEIQKAYLDMWLKNELLYKEALSKGLDKDTLFRKRLEYLKKQLLVNTIFQQLMQNVSTDVSLEEVKNYYDAHKNDYSTERRIAHITVPNQDVAREVIKRLKAGESFSKLVKQYSIDSTTINNGGVMGWFTRGDFLKFPEFEDTIFSLKRIGDIGGPVQSPYAMGYDVVKLVGKRRLRKARSFDEVKSDIESLLRFQKQQAAFDSIINDLKKKFNVEEAGGNG